MKITEITKDDFEKFYPIFIDIIQAQETYAFEPNMNFEESYHIWCQYPLKTFIIKEDDNILGTYYIKPNAQGPSSHICNCGYIVHPNSRGKGIATILCKHSQEIAKNLGFKAMQFNSVVSTNTIAVNIWKKLGYKIIGTIPDAYNHKKLGYVDAYIMYKKLI